MEGGQEMGKDVFEAARAFAKMDKLWKIHFRNVSAPIPHFVETFVDNGYTDMLKLMRTLHAVDFRGALIADHVPANDRPEPESAGLQYWIYQSVARRSRG